MTPKLELDTADEQDFTTRDFLLLASVNMLHHQINSDCDRCRYFVNIFEQSLKNKALSKEKVILNIYLLTILTCTFIYIFHASIFYLLWCI